MHSVISITYNIVLLGVLLACAVFWWSNDCSELYCSRYFANFRYLKMTANIGLNKKDLYNIFNYDKQLKCFLLIKCKISPWGSIWRIMILFFESIILLFSDDWVFCNELLTSANWLTQSVSINPTSKCCCLPFTLFPAGQSELWTTSVYLEHRKPRHIL